MKEKYDPLAQIIKLLNDKCNVKQRAYRSLKETFTLLIKEAKSVVKEINAKASQVDEDISISFIQESENEFHIIIAGDMLIFFMHTNIITLDKEHGLNKSPYVQEEPFRKYLGQINVYNFMHDSFKYNRLNDPGYLLSRIFVNYEGHFLIEGERQLNFMFEDVSSQPVTATDINIFVKILISQAIESDLQAPNFPDIRNITLNQKMKKTEALGSGKKIGFQMSYQQKTSD